MSWIQSLRLPRKPARFCLRCHRQVKSPYPSLLVCEQCREEIRRAIVVDHDYEELGCGD